MVDVSDTVDTLLLTGLRRTLERLGVEAFVSGPLIVHDRTCFPDPWTDDAAGVHQACRRALAHAGHPGVSVRILDQRGGDAGRDLVRLAAVGEGTIGVALLGLAPPKLLLHQIALEVARASLVLAEGVDTPYDEGGTSPRFPKGKAATLAEFALGFGTVALDGSSQDDQAVGGLPAAACAALLALQIVIRGRDELDAVRRGLSAEARALVEDAIGPLEGQRDALIGALGLPDPDTWPPPTAADPSALPPDPEGEASARSADAPAVDPRPDAATDEVAFAVPKTPWIQATALGGLAGTLGAGLMGSAIPLVAGLAAGFLVGRFVLSSQQCSACGRTLADTTACGGCGATIVGTIARRSDAAAAEEAYRARLSPASDGE